VFSCPSSSIFQSNFPLPQITFLKTVQNGIGHQSYFRKTSLLDVLFWVGAREMTRIFVPPKFFANFVAIPRADHAARRLWRGTCSGTFSILDVGTAFTPSAPWRLAYVSLGHRLDVLDQCWWKQDWAAELFAAPASFLTCVHARMSRLIPTAAVYFRLDFPSRIAKA
jgi:hypothetical protein